MNHELIMKTYEKQERKHRTTWHRRLVTDADFRNLESLASDLQKDHESHRSQSSFFIFSQELQISGEMWPYLKYMPGMNAWRFAIFTCRRHRQSLELRRTLPESRETNGVSLYAWCFSDHGVCRDVLYHGSEKNALLFAHAAAAGIGWNNGTVRCQTVWRRHDLRVRRNLTATCYLLHLVPEVSACEFVLNDGGPHYRWDKVTVTGSIESTTVLLRAIGLSCFFL